MYCLSGGGPVHKTSAEVYMDPVAGTVRYERKPPPIPSRPPPQSGAGYHGQADMETIELA